MNTKIRSFAFCLTACLLACSQSWAQRGPQDTWYETSRVAMPSGCNPQDLIVTPEGTLLLSDAGNHKIHELDENGSLIRSFGSQGSGNGQFNSPIEIAIGLGNRIYVADTANHRITILERNGTFVKTFGTIGAGDGQFNKPRGLAISSENEVFVSEDGNHRVQVFDANGTFLRKWGSLGNLDGQLNRPLSLDVDEDGNVYVAEYTNLRISIFNKSGVFRNKFSTQKWYSDNRTAAHVKILPTGLLATGGERGRDYDMLRLRDKDDGQYLKDIVLWSGNGGTWSPFDQFSDGSIVFSSRKLGHLVFLEQTYRTVCSTSSKDAPLPEVISVTQPVGTNHLEIKYRITDADSSKVKAGLLAFKDGGNDLTKVIVPKTFVGSIAGKLDENTTTGVVHTVTWDAKADWNVSYGNVELAVVAQDDRDLMNFHFLTLPGTETNSTELKISRSPLSNADLLNAWYTLLALTDDVSLDSGSIKLGNGNPKNMPGLKLWLDGKDINGDGSEDSPANGDEMAQWLGKSSAQFVFNGPSGKRPTYTSNGWFFNSGYVNSTQSYSGFKELVVVLNLVQNKFWGAAIVGARYKRFLALGGSTQKYNNETSQGFPGSITLNGTSNFSGTVPLSQNHTVFKVFDASVSGNQMHIGSNGDNYENWNGTISEVIAFDRELSEIERIRLRKYFGTKWGVTPPSSDNVSDFVSSGNTTAAGRSFLFDKMNLREATTAEVTRAKEAATPGSTNAFTPDFQVGPGERPVKVNEYGFDTGATSGYWVVPKN
jgi:sugar lactone lactonase YvrE